MCFEDELLLLLLIVNLRPEDDLEDGSLFFILSYLLAGMISMPESLWLEDDDNLSTVETRLEY